MIRKFFGSVSELRGKYGRPGKVGGSSKTPSSSSGTYRKFKNDKEAGEFGNSINSNELTSEELDMMKTYSTRDGGRINNYLRGDDSEGTWGAEKRIIDKALKKNVVPKNIVVYRRTSLFFVDIKHDTFKDMGYTSASLSEKWINNKKTFGGESFGYHLFKIEVPAGTNAYYIGERTHESNSMNQFELLLPRGTRFKVVDGNTLRVIGSGKSNDSEFSTKGSLEDFDRFILSENHIVYTQNELSNFENVSELSILEYSNIRADYYENIYNLVLSYVNGNTRFAKTQFSNAIIKSFQDAANLAWKDGDKKDALRGETFQWVARMQTEEISHASALIQRLSMLVSDNEGLDGEDISDIAVREAFLRAEGYARTLDSVYANVKLMAKPNVMLTFDGTDGKESCVSCTKYMGQRHRAKWWVVRNAVPPSRDFECKGFECKHFLKDDAGNLYTL